MLERFSVVITGINCSKDLAILLKSLSEQEVKPNEIIYVDAGSKDDSVKIAETAGCRVFIDVGAKTPASGRNVGLRVSNGEYVLFLDSDCILDDKNLIRKYYFYMKETSEEVAGIGSGYRYLEPRAYFTKILTRAIKYTLVNGGSPQFRSVEKVCIVDRLPGGNSCYKKNILLSVGGFDSTLKYCEEEELGRKIIKSGYKLIYHPELSISHKSFNSSRQFLSKLFHYGFWRGYYGLLKKMIRSQQLIALSIIILVMIFIISKTWYMLLGIIILYLSLLIVNIFLESHEKIKFHEIVFILIAAAVIHGTYITGLIVGLTKATYTVLTTNIRQLCNVEFWRKLDES